MMSATGRLKVMLTKLAPGRVWRGLGTIAGATVLSQLLPLLALPLVARHFGPEVLYSYFLFLALLLPLTIILGLRQDMSIASATSTDAMERNLHFSLAITSVLTLVGTPTVALLGSLWNAAWAMPAAAAVASAGVMAVNQSVLSAVTFRRDYRVAALAQIIPSVLASILQVVIVFKGASADWLIPTYFASMATATLFLLAAVGIPPWRISAGKIGRARWPQDWTSIRKFAIYSTPADAVNGLSSAAPIALLGRMPGGDQLGSSFGLGYRFAGAPVTFISRSMTLVFRGEASSEFRDSGQCHSSFRQFLKLSVAVVLTTAIALELFIPWGVPLLLGNTWENSVWVFQLLVPPVLMRVITGPLSYVLFLYQRQVLDLFLQMGYLAIAVLPFVLFTVPGTSAVIYASLTLVYQVCLVVLYAWISSTRKSNVTASTSFVNTPPEES